MDLLFPAVIAYALFVNGVAFFCMGEDKKNAKQKNPLTRRTSEGFLFLLAILGGGIGLYAGMFLFRHKTNKISFFLGIPLLMIEQALLIHAYFPFLIS